MVGLSAIRVVNLEAIHVVGLSAIRVVDLIADRTTILYDPIAGHVPDLARAAADLPDLHDDAIVHVHCPLIAGVTDPLVVIA